MTGYDIYKTAMELMGIPVTESGVYGIEDFLNCAVDFLNKILIDLKCEDSVITALTDTLTVKINVMDALPYGMAALFCASVGDDNRRQIFSSVYSAKRTAALSGSGKIKDVMPLVEELL